MKIVIVENPRPLTVAHYNDVANAPLSASLNSGYALAVASRSGWETAYLDFTASSLDAAAIAACIIAEEADIVLLHWVYSWGHEEIVRTVLALLHIHCSASFGAFGLFPSLSPVQVMRFAPELHFILAGEFEDTLAGLLPIFTAKNTIPALPGVFLRDGDFVPRALIDDLSLLPIPDDLGANCGYTTLNVAASRGCYAQCSFCFIHRYYGCSCRRTRDPASLERELEIRLARRDINSLYFIDPTFLGPGNTERKRVMDIGRMAERYGLKFGFEARVDVIDEDLLATLAGYGATSVFLGIESGCDSVLKRIGKRINTGQIRRGVRAARDCGMELNLGFIMFEPDSTLAELEQNYIFLEELELLEDHKITANLLYHNQIVLHGSAAWERLESQGRLLLDERLPFEAGYSFRDKRVGMVCAAMGCLTSSYFSAMESMWRGGSEAVDGGAVNAALKDAFRLFCRVARSADPQQLSALEMTLAANLHDIIVR